MTKDQKKKFNRIKLVLVEQEKSSSWLAAELRVSATAVSKWCTNRNQPTVETLFKIAELLRVEVSQLLVANSEDQRL
jgi:putative transcriptional regulator